MGRRSINTTKSGKYMNPTDQARKEARKRELKKNKKQRMLVRTAVLKGKDPHQVLADMDRLDQMEFNVDSPPPLNEKVLRDKRRKLKETWDRLCRLYVKEDHEKFLELKRLESEYESKRNKLIKFYESVKSAQEVALDDIPLPSGAPEQNSNEENIEELETEPSSILKKSGAPPVINKDPPGLPPGPPPSLDEIDDEESDDEESNRKVHFGDEKEADINEFLKEIEDVEKTVAENIPSSPEDNQLTESNLSEPEVSTSTVEDESTSSSSGTTYSSTEPSTTSGTESVKSMSSIPSRSSTITTIPPFSNANTPILTMAPTKIHPAPPPISPMLLLRPPPMNPQMRPNMPPPSGPPPRPFMRPPSHPRSQRHNAPRGGHQRGDRNQSHKNRNEDIKSKSSQVVSDKATIEAKPQLRNLSADAIRFTPVSLKVRRNEPTKKPIKPAGQESNFSFTSNPYNAQFKQQQQPTKDDAYEEFMRELKDII